MRATRTAPAALAAILFVAGCAGNGPDPVPPVGTAPTSAASTPATTPPRPPGASVTPTGEPSEDLPVPTRPASPKPGGPSPRPAGPTTLTGTVVAGVELNCLLLDGYLLIGGDRTVIRAGARVTVTGRTDREVMSTCQQGTPFVVTEAKPA